jgi:mono/diheme cytochrome c family protein
MKKLLTIGLLCVAPLMAQIDGDFTIPYIDFPVKKDSGAATYQANCMMCHSLGYIDNQGLQSKAFWQGKVDKMIIHFKAPITDQDAKTVTDYLYANYGNGKLK